jgi:molybdopterin/thiamine biosynthesis adenylyltransferase
MLRPWWERYPDRYERELEDLDEAGFEYQINEAEKKAGRLVLAVDAVVDGQTYVLEARFPDTYPKSRFEVVARELNLQRHQHPFDKNLCLIGGATLNWSTGFTLAQLLQEQLPQVLKIGAAADPSQYKGEEEPQGEPFSMYYTGLTDSALLVDSSWTIPDDAVLGDLEILVEKGGDPFRGSVARVLAKGQAVAQAADQIKELYVGKECILGHWIRVPEPIQSNDANDFLTLIFTKHQKWKHTKRPTIFGVIYKEEAAQGTYQDGWIFVLRTNSGKTALLKAAYGGREDLQARVPELMPLKEKRIAVVGLGSLGAPAAIEFARAGVGSLVLADFDAVEAGSTVRWPLGIAVAGKNKTTALRDFIKVNYPYTEISTFQAAVGRVAISDDYRDRDNLEDLVAADLVFDATAEIGVQNILSEVAVEAGKPYVCVTATAGLWGGIVARIVPGQTGCWYCLQRKIDSKEFIPAPMSNESGVQGTGCGSPTFTGSGFDASFIALSAVRLAVGMLASEQDKGYPNMPWDVAVIGLRDEKGMPIAPTFTTYPHPKTEGCAWCK